MTPLLGTFSAASVRGYRGSIQAVTAPDPEYWWRADSGLSTSGWTAYAGGLDFTFYNVTSANSTTGAYFNGTNSYGVTSNSLSNIDAKHIIVRTDSVALGTLLGGTQSGIHEFYFASYIVQYGTDANWGVDNAGLGTTTTWVDFTNYATPRTVYDTNNYSTNNTLNVYFGTFPNYFRWLSGFGIYLGKRGNDDSYGQFYIKEIAIFTSAQSLEKIQAFRDAVNIRWP